MFVSFAIVAVRALTALASGEGGARSAFLRALGPRRTLLGCPTRQGPRIFAGSMPTSPRSQVRSWATSPMQLYAEVDAASARE